LIIFMEYCFVYSMSLQRNWCFGWIKGAWDHTDKCIVLFLLGQNELVTTNALVGHFVHWMGYIFSFGIKWGSSQSISFHYWPLYFFFCFVLFCFFPGLDLTHSYLLTFLPS
jgi:hypothetical protein